MIFNRHELATELPLLRSLEASGLESIEFTQNAFTSPDSEQCIMVFRGSKLDYPSMLLFWIKTIQAQGWEGRESYFTGYVEAGLCEQVSKNEFADIIKEYARELQEPLPKFICDLTGYQCGLRMYAEWNDIATVAELNDEYIAFYWSTSA